MKEAGVEVITDLDRKAFSDALGTQVRDMFVKMFRRALTC